MADVDFWQDLTCKEADAGSFMGTLELQEIEIRRTCLSRSSIEVAELISG